MLPGEVTIVSTRASPVDGGFAVIWGLDTSQLNRCEVSSNHIEAGPSTDRNRLVPVSGRRDRVFCLFGLGQRL